MSESMVWTTGEGEYFETERVWFGWIGGIVGYTHEEGDIWRDTQYTWAEFQGGA